MQLDYFSLSPTEQLSKIRAAENILDISDVAIEKYAWICWLLEKLFERTEYMAFKGGTSLSRIFNVTHRYSEDIDITIDYRNFTGSPFCVASLGCAHF